MEHTDFRQQLIHLAESWEERRMASTFSRRRVLTSQLELLGLIHGWASDAIAEVVAVYGPAIEAATSAISGSDERLFVVEVGQSHANFRLARDAQQEDSWRTAATLRLSGDPPGKEHAHRPREWTRKRVEEIVLRMVGAFERSRAGMAIETRDS